MAKFIQIGLFVTCVAICCASPARLSNRKQRVSARQEVAEDVPAQTPYPPAGIVPQVRFDLPTENVAVEPDNTYLPPDSAAQGIPAKTYGPPQPVEPKNASDDESPELVTEEPEEAQTDETQTEESTTELPTEAKEVDEGLSQQPEVQEPLHDEAEDNEIETGPDEEELLLVVPLTPRNKTGRLQARPLRPQRVIAQAIPYRSQRLIGQQLFLADDGRYYAFTPQYVRI